MSKFYFLEVKGISTGSGDGLQGNDVAWNVRAAEHRLSER